jgi:hypothetical protein
MQGVGGARYSLMTEWDDLVLAVRCAWEVPGGEGAEEGGTEEGPGRALLRELGVGAPRWRPRLIAAPPRPVASPDDFYHALRWAFDHVRAAVLVSIRQGRIALFLPFANDGGWRLGDGAHIKLPRGITSVKEYAAEKHRTQRAKRREDMIQDTNRWWFNGHVVCNVRPADVWGDFQLTDLHEILLAATQAARIPDVDVLLNKRDSPLLVNPHLHAGQPRLPILSPYTSFAALDLPFPLADDWRLAKEGRSSRDSPFARWNARAPRAVFRGSSTGRGLTPETNLRLALALFAAQPDNAPWLDVRITRVNERCQLLPQPGALNVDYPRAVELRAVLREAGAWGPYESLAAQARRFRIAIYVRGHQAASRLGALFRQGFCVVMLRPLGEEFEAPGCWPWFEDMLVPYEGWRRESSGEPSEELGGLASAAGAKPAGGLASAAGAKPAGGLASAAGAKPADEEEEADAPAKRPRAAGAGGSGRGARTMAAGESPKPGGLAPSLDPVTPNQVVCVAHSLPELVQCVKFLANHDNATRAIAENGYRAIGRGMLNREAIARRAAEVLVQAAAEGRAPQVSSLTHPLYGMTNPAMVATRSARF